MPTKPYISGLQQLAEYGSYSSMGEYMNRQENAGFQDKLKTRKTNSYEKDYKVTETSPSQTPKLTEKDLQTLAEKKPELSEQTLNTLRGVSNVMDAMSPDVDPEFKNDDRPLISNSEAGIKFYAFFPLDRKSRELEKAVKDGDMKAIRKAHEEYTAPK